MLLLQPDEDECDGITVGGTSAADDYDCTSDSE